MDETLSEQLELGSFEAEFSKEWEVNDELKSRSQSQGYADLHTHSTHSDGHDRPSDVLLKAKAAGLAGLALTDHDTLAGIDEAKAKAA
ncbi:MAG: PHP domain-containing protein [Anaerotruncus sp.]|nr:PHP domain-containing protein [Anaerotruncus sp.]